MANKKTISEDASKLLVDCPFCRRPQKIDVKSARITCGHCGNGFSWDANLRKAVILPPGSGNKPRPNLPAPSLPPAGLSLRWLGVVVAGIVGAIIVAFFFIQHQPAMPVEKGVPNADLEEIDKQLKSLAE